MKPHFKPVKLQDGFTWTFKISVLSVSDARFYEALTQLLDEGTELAETEAPVHSKTRFNTPVSRFISFSST